MRINTNISSLNVQRNLASTTKVIARSLERLSSASRINRAGDDASGLAISEGISSQVRALRYGALNINYAQSLIDSSLGALSVQMDIVQRMRELAVQASNGVIGSEDRQYLDVDFQEMLNEFSRITNTMSFNGSKLLDGSMRAFDIQVGSKKRESIQIRAGSSKLNEVFTKQVNNGSFTAKPTITSGIGAQDIQSGDINGDGRIDSITANASGTYTSFVQSTNGQLTQFEQASLGDSPVQFELADINADGSLDMIVADAGYGSGTSAILVLLGRGNGSFDKAKTIATGVEFSSVKIADITGNGQVDIVASDFGNNSIEIFEGIGGGDFNSAGSLATGTNPSDIQLADLNRDGLLDVVSSDFGDGQVSIHLGAGGGNFSLAVRYAAGANPGSLALGDLDHDGIIDLVTSDAGDGTLSILRGLGNGTFAARSSLAVGTDPQKVKLFDVNSDGLLDIVLANGSDASISILNNRGNNSFAAAQDLETGANTKNIVFDDFNSDGVHDLLAVGSGDDSISFYHGRSQSVSAVADLSVRTQSSAQNVLAILDLAVLELNTRMSDLGAQSNRLQSALQVSLITQESLSAAASQIKDLDYGIETAELSRHQILQQAQIAVMSQANSSLQTVLSLLQF